MNKKDTNSLNEQLKIVEQNKKNEKNSHNDNKVKLDDSQRVKVLSPGRLVFKRFIRNKLAIVGSAVLILMFAFAFLGPLFYPYAQDEIFYEFDKLNVKYAMATERTEYIPFIVDQDAQVDNNVKNMMHSNITAMIESNEIHKIVTDSKGNEYYIDLKDNGIYTLSMYTNTQVGEYNLTKAIATYEDVFGGVFTYVDSSMPSAFETKIKAAVSSSTEEIEYNGKTYSVTSSFSKKYSIELIEAYYEDSNEMVAEQAFIDTVIANINQSSFFYDSQKYVIQAASTGHYLISAVSDVHPVILATTYAISPLQSDFTVSSEFKVAAYLAMSQSTGFTVDGKEYSITENEEDGIIISDVSANENVAQVSDFVMSYYDGKTIYDLDYKAALKAEVLSMVESDAIEGSFIYRLQQRDAITGDYILDENEVPVLEDIEMNITRELGKDYIVNCEQTTYLMDIYAPPSSAHLAGTDNNGMDVLARMMYGGRISLMVGFVVVIIETLLGVIMGGIAGYFGGWIDTIIMRLVDIFYCIPTMPILIIIGAFFDHEQMNSYLRLVWLMAVLGFLGWAYVARLVRGQILSLREQEFMIATEATGVRINRRIFKHLIPNVMPQLIVTATAGLGGVILTESTLSFLGLGVKHPLSTWGVMINSVTGSPEQMTSYLYIWIPVGLLICLTVIAFNFVGDGMRDAFDPKMKR